MAMATLWKLWVWKGNGLVAFDFLAGCVVAQSVSQSVSPSVHLPTQVLRR